MQRARPSASRARHSPRVPTKPCRPQLNDLHLLDTRGWAWVSVRLLAAPSPRGCGTLCSVPSAAGSAGGDILLFGGSCGWEAEAARATTFLGDTHRLPLGEVLDALDQSAAAATAAAAAGTDTTEAAAAAGEAAAADGKAAPEAAEKENAANAKEKATHPLAEAAAAPPEGAKRSRKQKAPVKRMEGPVESLVQNAAP